MKLKTEIICRSLIVVVLFLAAVIGYTTLLCQKELRVFKILLGAILILWGFRDEKVKRSAINKWVMRIGGVGLILSGVIR